MSKMFKKGCYHAFLTVTDQEVVGKVLEDVRGDGWIAVFTEVSRHKGEAPLYINLEHVVIVYPVTERDYKEAQEHKARILTEKDELMERFKKGFKF